jgi:hypothetical protein
MLRFSESGLDLAPGSEMKVFDPESWKFLDSVSDVLPLKDTLVEVPDEVLNLPESEVVTRVLVQESPSPREDAPRQMIGAGAGLVGLPIRLLGQYRRSIECLATSNHAWAFKGPIGPTVARIYVDPTVPASEI